MMLGLGWNWWVGIVGVIILIGVLVWKKTH
jgi:hypothetical protein